MNWGRFIFTVILALIGCALASVAVVIGFADAEGLPSIRRNQNNIAEISGRINNKISNTKLTVLNSF